MIVDFTKDQMASSTTTTPPHVDPDMPNGCETGACALAKCFYDNNFQVLRRLRFRRELSEYFIRTFATWAPPEVVANPALQRSFSQVLFALVHDGKILRVSNSKLSWAINRTAHAPHRTQSHRRHSHERPRGRTHGRTHGRTPERTPERTPGRTPERTPGPPRRQPLHRESFNSCGRKNMAAPDWYDCS